MDQLMKVGAHYETEAVTGKGASAVPSGESDPLFAMPCMQIKACTSLTITILDYQTEY